MPARFRQQVALLTVTRFILHTAGRMLYPFLPIFAQGLGVNLSTIALAVTAQDAAGGIGPFLAFIADSRGRKTGILVGLGIFIVGTGLIVLKPVFPVFLLALVLIAISISVVVPSIHAYLGDQVSYERRGFTIAVTELSWSAAFILGVPLAGLLIAHWGWMSPFWLLALLGCLVFAGVAWLLPPDRPDSNLAKSALGNFRSVLSYGPAVAGILLGALIACGNEVVNLVFGVWMENSFMLNIAALGAASMVIGLSELGGEGLAGGVVDRLGKERSIRIGLLGNCLAAASFPVLGHSLVGALVSLFFFYLTFEFVVVACLPLLTEIYPAVRGTLMALSVASFSLGRAAGTLVGPPLFQQWGIAANAAAAIGLDLVALLVLRQVKLRASIVEEIPG